MLKISILGNDLSALLTAHYATEMGFTYDIYASSASNPPAGSECLERRVTGFPLDQCEWERINSRKEGTSEGYSMKKFGLGVDVPPVPGFPGRGSTHVLDATEVYWKLWYRYATEQHQWLYQYSKDVFDDDLGVLRHDSVSIFSSLPLRSLCKEDHGFVSRQAWVIEDSDTSRCPVRLSSQTVIHDGTDCVGWYKAANIFDRCSVEWPAHEKSPKPPFPGVSKVEFPVSTDCDCFSDLIRVGTNGTWTHTDTADDVHDTVTTKLAALVVE